MKQSLADRILAYYRKNSGVWISGGEIERLVAQHTTYKASNASRRLRELREDGLLEAKEVKGTVFYRYVPKHQERTVVEVVGNVAYKRVENVLV
jgi:DNA-binding transcriptional ArsR family regulator